MGNELSGRQAVSSPQPHPETVPLSTLQPGEQGVVVKLAAGRNLTSRMASLGFTPGAHVMVVQNFGRGPLIAIVRAARIALGRGEAARIYVRRSPSG